MSCFYHPDFSLSPYFSLRHDSAASTWGQYHYSHWGQTAFWESLKAKTHHRTWGVPIITLTSPKLMESHSPRMTHVLNPSDTILLKKKNTPCFGLREDSVSGLLTARPRVGIVALLPSFPFLYHWRQAVAWGYCKGRRGATGPITAGVQKSDFGPQFYPVTVLQRPIW